jgi:hypothetical protein
LELWYRLTTKDVGAVVVVMDSLQSHYGQTAVKYRQSKYVIHISGMEKFQRCFDSKAYCSTRHAPGISSPDDNVVCQDDRRGCLGVPTPPPPLQAFPLPNKAREVVEHEVALLLWNTSPSAKIRPDGKEEHITVRYN